MVGRWSVEFQMTASVEQKERDPKFVLDGVEKINCGLKGTNRLMMMNIRRKILRRVCIYGFICYAYGGKLETNSSVNR